MQQLVNLTSSQIDKLDKEQMKNLLLMIQVQRIKKNHPQIHHHKNKTIRKECKIKQLKRIVKNKMKKTIGNRKCIANCQARANNQHGTLDNRRYQKYQDSNIPQLQPKQHATLNNNFSSKIKSALCQIDNDTFSCPICLQILINPTLTPCGHNFCEQCLDQSLLFMSTCPNCRENIKGCEPAVCATLDKLIRFRVITRGKPEEIEHYNSRYEKFQKWKQQRNVNYQTLKKGQRLDVRDTQSIWCQATIQQIYKQHDPQLKKRKTVAVLVRYHRWHKIYNEIIDIPSRRLAPLNLFFRRNDIPHYRLNQEDGNVRGSVSIGHSRIQVPQAIPFIRIEDSQELEEDSFFASSLEEADNLSHLAPENQENENLDEAQEENEEQQVQSNENDRSSRNHSGLREYFRNLRTNLIERLLPRPPVRPMAEADLADNQSEEAQDSGHISSLVDQEQSLFQEPRSVDRGIILLQNLRAQVRQLQKYDDDEDDDQYELESMSPLEGEE